MKHLGDALASAVQEGHLYNQRPDMPLNERAGRQCAIMASLEPRLEAQAGRFGLSKDRAAEMIKAGYEHVERLHKHTESPIERDVATALIFGPYDAFGILSAISHIPKEETRVRNYPVTIIPQFAILKYRLDFAVIGRSGDKYKVVAVECDGAEFHKNRTTADWNRDLYLRSLGFEVVRASGKEIVNAPLMIAERVAAALALGVFGL